MSIYGKLNNFDQRIQLLETSNLFPNYTTLTASNINGTSAIINSITASNFSASAGLANLTTLTASNIKITNTTQITGNIKFVANYGIDFGANASAAGMTSEIFNDYEEGTWTPIYFGSSTGGNIVYGTNIGYYTKIGRMVYINCFISTDVLTVHPVGNLQIRGLPFTVNNASMNYSPALTTDLYQWGISSIIDIKGKFEAGTTYMTLRKVTGQGSSQQGNLVGSDMSTGTDSNWLLISGMYWT